LKLYDLPPSPNARRVRIFIAEKGIDIPMIPVNMMAGENSTDLHPEPPLLGKDTLGRALVEMWQRRMEFEFLLPMISIFRHTGEMWKGRITQIPEMAEAEGKNVKARMEWLNKELAGKQFIAGEDYTVADITAQTALVMGKAALGIRIPDELTNLNEWWARVSSRPTARA